MLIFSLSLFSLPCPMKRTPVAGSVHSTQPLSLFKNRCRCSDIIAYFLMYHRVVSNAKDCLHCQFKISAFQISCEDLYGVWQTDKCYSAQLSVTWYQQLWTCTMTSFCCFFSLCKSIRTGISPKLNSCQQSRRHKPKLLDSPPLSTLVRIQSSLSVSTILFCLCSVVMSSADPVSTLCFLSCGD